MQFQQGTRLEPYCWMLNDPPRSTCANGIVEEEKLRHFALARVSLRIGAFVTIPTDKRVSEDAERAAREYASQLETWASIAGIRRGCETAFLAGVEYALRSKASEREAGEFNLVAHLERQRAFSERTFGPGMRTAGVSDHIRKELTEVAKAPDDLEEWIDVVMLALDGAWRCGAASRDIAVALAAKLEKNERRKWPDWRTVPEGKAIEHDRSADAASPSLKGAQGESGEWVEWKEGDALPVGERFWICQQVWAGAIGREALYSEYRSGIPQWFARDRVTAYWSIPLPPPFSPKQGSGESHE